MVEMSVPGGHGDGLMSRRLLNDLEIDPSLSQSAAESMTEIVPAKVRNLRMFDCFIPPRPVLPDVEDPFASRHFAEIVHGSESIIVHVDCPRRSILCVVCHEPPRDEIHVRPQEAVLLTLPHPGVAKSPGSSPGNATKNLNKINSLKASLVLRATWLICPIFSSRVIFQSNRPQKREPQDRSPQMDRVLSSGERTPHTTEM
jgi:hypothetical protein